MDRNAKLPNDARLMKCYFGTIPTGPLAGKSISFNLYEGELSRGYQTNYQRAPMRWYRIEVEGDKSRQWSYSGKRLEQAVIDYDQNVADFQKAVNA